MNLKKKFAMVAAMNETQQTSFVRGTVFVMILALFVGMIAYIPTNATAGDLQIKNSQVL